MSTPAGPGIANASSVAINCIPDCLCAAAFGWGRVGLQARPVTESASRSDARTRHFQRCGPPQQIVHQCPGGSSELCESGVDIAALEVRPEDGDWDVDRGAHRSELQLDGNFAELLSAACARHAAVAH